jgi:hypothetical protein
MDQCTDGADPNRVGRLRGAADRSWLMRLSDTGLRQYSSAEGDSVRLRGGISLIETV